MKKFFLILVLSFICVGCSDKRSVSRFQEEYEKYNDEYLELHLENADYMKYSSISSINDMINSGTGVIFIGSPLDNYSRVAIDILLKVASNTDLEEIYYIDSLDGVRGLDDIKDIHIPVVLFVLDGDIVHYHVGTINNKESLTEDEEIELYNLYSEGVHQVLQDACDESC